MLIDVDFTQFKPALQLRKTGDKTEIFDPVRKKFLVLQPEELVRQLVIQFLSTHKNYPLSKMRVELGLTVNELQKRSDIVVFDHNVKPLLLVECKSIHVPITQAVFDQIARYNLKFRVPFLLVTNGLSTFCCRMGYDTEGWEFLPEVPFFEEAVQHTK